MTLMSTTMPSPVGKLTLVASDAGLVAVLWPEEREGRVPLAGVSAAGGHSVFDAAAKQLTEYFAGRRRAFALPLDPRGTAFQRAVWAALSEIPYGETRSYGDIARKIGRRSAVRAVGAANGRNPLSIIVPCHRVVGQGGALTGFAGGLAAKRYLLDLEKAVPSIPAPASAVPR
jgi:methylated-DNA-[protein]-cysteine S-methyltransferase